VRLFAKAAPLVRTMDIFLRDPIVDWVESCASKRPDDDDDAADDGSGSGSSSSAKAVWEPSRRIRNARRKLSGANPIAVLLDDLRQNPSVAANKSLPALERILRGEAGGGGRLAPARARLPRLQEATLSAADQVECLVDLAADPNVLGRQWVGLATWM
jgi:DNA-dependent protein kinase catalytic subunit